MVDSGPGRLKVPRFFAGTFTLLARQIHIFERVMHQGAATGTVVEPPAVPRAVSATAGNTSAASWMLRYIIGSGAGL